jgi:hypothetical protein
MTDCTVSGPRRKNNRDARKKTPTPGEGPASENPKTNKRRTRHRRGVRTTVGVLTFLLFLINTMQLSPETEFSLKEDKGACTTVEVLAFSLFFFFLAINTMQISPEKELREDSFDTGWEEGDVNWIKPNRNVQVLESDVKTIPIVWMIQPQRLRKFNKRMEEFREQCKKHTEAN